MWEILELKICTETNQNRHFSIEKEYYKRIRLFVEDQNLLGTFISKNDISNENLVEKALNSLEPITDFNPKELKFTDNQFELQKKSVESIKSKEILHNGVSLQEIEVYLHTSNGGRIVYTFSNMIKKESDLNSQGIINLIKGLNINLNNHSKTWLFTPYALSKIFLNYFIGILKGKSKDEIIPNNIGIIDRGHQIFDLEGFKKSTTVFIEDGTIINYPTDLMTSLKTNKKQTGHGGLSGISVQDIYVNSEYSPELDETKSVLIIEDAHVINKIGNMFNIVLKPYRTKPFVVKLIFTKDFFLKGNWVYRVEKGIHPWKSPWFLLDNNEQFEILP